MGAASTSARLGIISTSLSELTAYSACAALRIQLFHGSNPEPAPGTAPEALAIVTSPLLTRLLNSSALMQPPGKVALSAEISQKMENSEVPPAWL
jgi:hypothetical protein